MSASPPPQKPGFSTPVVIALALCVPMALLPEFVFGSPSKARLALCVVLGLGVFAASRVPQAWVSKVRWGWVLAVTMILAQLAFSALSIIKYAHYGDILARDAAYYDQIFRSAVAGLGWKGSILHELYHDPPLESQWAIHVTPIAWLMLPIYALLPSLDTLLVVRNAFIVVAAWPMYLLARRRLGPAPSFVLAVSLLATPTLLYQPLNSFYFYGAVLTPFLFAWYFHEEGRPVAFLVSCGALLMVREDIGIAVSALGGAAIVDGWLEARREGKPAKTALKWPYLVALLAGGAWWIAMVKAVMPRFGSASGAATRSWYAGWGSTPGEMLQRLFLDPAYTFGVLFGPAKVAYLWGLARSVGFLGMWGVPFLVALPYLAINLLVTREGAATADITYHYSLLIVAALYASLPRAIERLAGGVCQRQRVCAVLVLAMSLSSLTVVFSADQIQILRGKPEVALFDRLVDQIPEDAASVSAPSRLLPALTRHPRLIASDRPMGYTRVHADWVILAEGPGTYFKGDWDEARWSSYFEVFNASGQYERVYEEGGYGVYRRSGKVEGHEGQKSP